MHEKRKVREIEARNRILDEEKKKSEEDLRQRIALEESRRKTFEHFELLKLGIYG